MSNLENTCLNEAIHEDLKAYLDGELPALRRLVVGFHLTRCDECRREIEIMERIGDSLKTNSEEAALPSALKSRILDSAPAAVESLPAPPHKTQRPSWRGYGKELAALGALMVVAVFMTTATLGKKVQTVFNTANTALNTSTDGLGEYYESESSPAARPANNALPASRSAREYAKSEEERAVSSLDRMGGTTGSRAVDALPNALRKVHKEGRITVEVKQAEAATDETISLIKSVGGFVANNTLSTGAGGAKTATIEARVPVGSFETIMGQVGKLGEIRAKNVVGEDITEKYSDAQQATNVLSNDLSISEAQLKNALERAKKKDRPGQIPWEMRAEVRELRIRAAQSRARFNLYRKISDLSNISIELEEKVKVPGEGGFLDNISQSGSEAMQTFQVAARVPVNCVIWILAYSPLWLPLLIGLRIVMLKTQRSR